MLWLAWQHVRLRPTPNPGRGLQQPDGEIVPQHGCRAERRSREVRRAHGVPLVAGAYSQGGSCSYLLSQGLAEGSLLGTGRERASDQQLQAQPLLVAPGGGFRAACIQGGTALERTLTSLWEGAQQRSRILRSWSWRKQEGWLRHSLRVGALNIWEVSRQCACGATVKFPDARIPG